MSNSTLGRVASLNELSQLDESTLRVEPPSEPQVVAVSSASGWSSRELQAFLAGMHHASRFISDLPSLSKFVLELALQELCSRRGSLMVVENQQILRIMAARGLPDWVQQHTALRLGEGVAGVVASAGRPLLVENLAQGSHKPHGTGHYQSATFLSVPVPGERGVLGVVNVTDPVHDAPFQRRDLDQLVSIASSAGATMEQAIRYRAYEDLAIRDDLTGLYNRRYLMQFLDSILERAREEGFPVTVLLFDLDHFKQCNDMYGHPAGDQVLRELAQLMLDSFRSHDVVCRLGGEEFAVVLWDGRGTQSGSGWQGYPSTAFEFAERLRKATMQHRFRAINRQGITLSGGLATFPWDGVTPDEIIERADQALYRAKQDGRNRVYLCGENRPH